MDQQQFDNLVKRYTEIVDRHATPRLRYYQARVGGRRFAARISAVAIIALSLIIPVATNFWPAGSVGASKELGVSVLSLLIAFLSGLRELYKWDETWKEYAGQMLLIEAAFGAWELEVAGCRGVQDPTGVDTRLNQATGRLLATVEHLVQDEMHSFFKRSGQRGVTERPGE